LDHLDAIVFIDRMQMVQRLVLSKELKELAETTRKQLAGSQA
jgi:peptide deformylase